METASAAWPLRKQGRVCLGLAAAATTLLFLGMALGLLAVRLLGYGVVVSVSHSLWAQALGFLLGVAGAPSALLLWGAMWWYWLAFDSSSRRRKVFWFALMLAAGPLGTWAYYLRVYCTEDRGDRSRSPIRPATVLTTIALCGCLLSFATIGAAYFVPTILRSKLTIFTLYIACFGCVVPVGVWLLVKLLRKGLRIVRE